MRYPTVPQERSLEVAHSLLEETDYEVPSTATKWEGSGKDVELGPVEAAAEAILADLELFRTSKESSDRDRFEGQASGALHRSLKDLPTPVLDDPGFWRFLTLNLFWDLVVWRQDSAFETGDPARYRRYVDATSISEAVIPRMFLRAQIALRNDDYHLASAVRNGTDLWRSHILRVGTGGSPAVAQALLQHQEAQPLNTDDLRQLARRLNRVSTNIVLEVYDADDANSLISELRAEI